MLSPGGELAAATPAYASGDSPPPLFTITLAEIEALFGKRRDGYGKALYAATWPVHLHPVTPPTRASMHNLSRVSASRTLTPVQYAALIACPRFLPVPGRYWKGACMGATRSSHAMFFAQPCCGEGVEQGCLCAATELITGTLWAPSPPHCPEAARHLTGRSTSSLTQCD